MYAFSLDMSIHGHKIKNWLIFYGDLDDVEWAETPFGKVNHKKISIDAMRCTHGIK